MTITLLWNGHNTLGEGPLWDYRDQALYWLDIEQKLLNRLVLTTQQHQQWTLPSRPGSIGLHKLGGLIAALEKGFVHIKLPVLEISPLAQVLSSEQNLRFNDGKTDREGHFWAGSIDLAEQNPIGCLYRADADGKVHEMDQGFTVANGIGWNLDNTIMYFTDSPARTIYQYDYAAQTSTISQRKIFAKIPEDRGFPDGLTVDSQGYVWSAHWDGWCITRYAPDGSIDKIINTPVQRPTSCCFGGAEFDTLFITSARRDLSATELAKGPLAGSVLKMDAGVSGRPEPLFG